VLKCLIFCIDFREKYLRAIGPDEKIFSLFDIIIDATKVAKPNKEKAEYSDLIINEKVIVVDEFIAIKKIFEENDIGFTLIFNPADYNNLKDVYELIQEKSLKWGICINKMTLRIFSFKNIVKFVYSIFVRIVNSKNIKLKPDFLFTNIRFFYKLNGLKNIKFKKVYTVRHFDAIPRLKESEFKIKYALFLDQYLPFHSGIVEKYKLDINPEQYYNELLSYLEIIKNRYRVDDIFFARHPNSNGNELPYLKNYKTFIGETSNLTHHAEFVITHYSDSIAFAIQTGKNVITVNLPNTLPGFCQNFVFETSKNIASELHIFDGNLKIVKSSYIKAYFIRKLYKAFYNPNGKYVIDFVENL